jgi:hypothetical protein
MAYDRSKGKLHEQDHSHRHEKDFRVTARRNKLLGLWAAELMNIRGAEAEAYAKQVVSADLEEPGDEDVVRKVCRDFERHGVSMPREKIRKKMDELLAEARHQLEAR